MPQPRDILDAPGPLPGDVIAALGDDADDPNVIRAKEQHPGLDLGVAWWDVRLDAVVILRDQLERVENQLRWEVRVAGGEFYVLAFSEGGVTLAAVEPRPMFEGAYIASRDLRHARSA